MIHTNTQTTTGVMIFIYLISLILMPDFLLLHNCCKVKRAPQILGKRARSVVCIFQNARCCSSKQQNRNRQTFSKPRYHVQLRCIVFSQALNLRIRGAVSPFPIIFLRHISVFDVCWAVHHCDN